MKSTTSNNIFFNQNRNSVTSCYTYQKFRLLISRSRVRVPQGAQDIIGGLGYTINWDLFFDKINWVSSGFDIKIAKYGKLKIIDFYHPSYQVPRAMSYSLLKAIMTSKA